MSDIKLPEVWLRGPLENIPGLLQPVAHALLQANEEIDELMQNFDASLLWKRPANVASVAFHLQHIAGVQDRLFTYAKEEMLSQQQLDYLKNEGKENDAITIKFLLENLEYQTQKSVAQLNETNITTLTEIRYVGRKKIATTVMGLLFHSAEHTMRHAGQLLVTVRILSAAK
ncbi:MAG: DinB family protein [Parafilimonas sp.]